MQSTTVLPKKNIGLKRTTSRGSLHTPRGRPKFGERKHRASVTTKEISPRTPDLLITKKETLLCYSMRRKSTTAMGSQARDKATTTLKLKQRMLPGASCWLQTRLTSDHLGSTLFSVDQRNCFRCSCSPITNVVTRSGMRISGFTN